ncbi:unnamed protein product, partial [Sphacelaria rigidula]
GLQCFCGVNGDDFDRLGDSKECTVDCAGDDNETCGGLNAIGVYHGASAPTGPSYLGCYTDEASNRIFTSLIATDTAAMTIE